MISQKNIARVVDYIKKNWSKCIRNITEDFGNVIGTPFPFTVPADRKLWDILFYWDTYFSNVGLLKLGEFELAKNNTDNLLYFVNRFGFVPNGNRTFFLNRSHPPFLSMMVKDIYEKSGDKKWLRSVYFILKREYEFYMNERITPIGLNRYYHHAENIYLNDFFDKELSKRLQLNYSNEGEKLKISANLLAEAESGWDFTPRFEGKCTEFIPVDLNSNLYIYEKNFAEFSNILNLGESESWIEKSEKRKDLINRFCWNSKRGLYLDYNFKTEKHTNVESLAAFFPLWAKTATPDQTKSLEKNLDSFEYNYGLSACKRGTRENIYQWDYPNGWPPLHYIAVEGLKNYGFNNEAERIAQKFVSVVVKNFKETGSLWEKYNVTDGSINVNNEYEMPEMMGWTSGVFIHFMEYLT